MKSFGEFFVFMMFVKAFGIFIIPLAVIVGIGYVLIEAYRMPPEPPPTEQDLKRAEMKRIEAVLAELNGVK